MGYVGMVGILLLQSNQCSIHKSWIGMSFYNFTTPWQEQRLQDATKLEKLPDMIFGHNYIRFHYPATGFEYVCNAIDGVRLISKQPDAGIKVSHSEKWSSGYVVCMCILFITPNRKKLDEYMEKSFNWTFSTAYQGTLLVNDKEPEVSWQSWGVSDIS